MKVLFFLFLSFGLYSQQLGVISYLEGGVSIGWDPVYIGRSLNWGDWITTEANGVVEIRWNNGRTSTVSHSSNVRLEELWKGSNMDLEPSLFDGFKKLFSSSAEKKRSEEGGVRREQVEIKTDTIHSLYWKGFELVGYEKVVRVYSKGDYLTSVKLLKQFIEQNPYDPKTKYALFALGHSYVKLGNMVDARKVFGRFVGRYDGGLAKESKVILNQLNSVYENN